MPDKIAVVAVIGPTASGKSKLGVELCKTLDGEVISADSMQVYKNMDIATAKPDYAERENVPHYLMDILAPEQSFSVAGFCAMAGECVEDISNRGKLPVIVGGTGLYVDALLSHTQFPPAEADYVLRERLKAIALEKGAEVLLDELMGIDPETAQNLHPKDLGRIIRAIELYYTTGITMSRHIQMSRLSPSPYKACIIGLGFKDRQILYDRINNRVDEMIEKGLVKEAEQFFKKAHSGTSKQAIGYKELLPYLEGKCELEPAVENLKQETRKYAKRQLTWFRKNENIQWLFADEYENQDDMTAAAVRLILESGTAREVS